MTAPKPTQSDEELEELAGDIRRAPSWIEGYNILKAAIAQARVEEAEQIAQLMGTMLVEPTASIVAAAIRARHPEAQT